MYISIPILLLQMIDRHLAKIKPVREKLLAVKAPSAFDWSLRFETSRSIQGLQNPVVKLALFLHLKHKTYLSNQ